MDIINGLHGLGIALAIGAVLTLILTYVYWLATEDTPPRTALVIAAAITAGIIAGFLIGATA